MQVEIRRLTHRYSVIAAAVSVVTHPLPGVDEITIIPVHYHFSVKMAKSMGLGIRNVPWRQVNTIIWGGALLRFGADLAVGLVPIAGALSHGLTAAALTEVLGQYLHDALTGQVRAPLTLRSLKDLLRAQVGAAALRVPWSASRSAAR